MGALFFVYTAMRTCSTALGIAASLYLASQLTSHSPTLTELPRLSERDAACGAAAINDKGQIIGWSGEPG